MGLTSAVHWWEESQLRVLVLSSLIIQWLLFLSCRCRRRAISGCYRSIIWLAYLGSDAVAIYSLATLFNRHNNQDRGGGSTILEVVWAPVLLIHLGGQDDITAYNVEDNELWTRHVLTAVSQITVAIYVFSKSWPPGGDKKLLAASILLFFVGVPKCLEKPWALKSASINNLVSSSELARKTTNREGEVEGFVRGAKAFVREQMEANEKEAFVQDSDHPEEEDQEEIKASCFQCVKKVTWDSFMEGYRSGKLPKAVQGDDHPESPEEGVFSPPINQGVPLKLFVDLSYPYPNRLGILKSFWMHDEEKAYHSLQEKLANVFSQLYTKEKISPFSHINLGLLRSVTFKFEKKDPLVWKFIWENKSSVLAVYYGGALRYLRLLLPWATIGLFHHSHIEAYNDTDVKITYALLCCTAMLEICTSVVRFNPNRATWPGIVSQYDLVGFFARSKNHTKKLSIVSLIGLKDYVEQHWWIESCYTSRKIIGLVLRYAKTGWKEDNSIHDAASYRKFNDNMGQRTLQLNDCKNLLWSLNRPFDESVLLWHIATDFCFYKSSFTKHRCTFPQRSRRTRGKKAEAPGRQTGPQCEELIECKVNICRQMSNYMIYLLFVNPEMLLPGSRRNLFTTAYKELECIIKDIQPPVKEKELMLRIDCEMQSTSGSQEEGFIHDAWSLAQGLRAKLGDEKKMWEVIEGVWVEMLCFSAGRCRGYLHAKALGTGGELLTYVWLLLSNMGMETFAERLRRTEHSSGAGNTGASPSTSEVPSNGSALLTSVAPTGAASSTFEVPSGAAPSTSEIRAATAGDDMV